MKIDVIFVKAALSFHFSAMSTLSKYARYQSVVDTTVSNIGFQIFLCIESIQIPHSNENSLALSSENLNCLQQEQGSRLFNVLGILTQVQRGVYFEKYQSATHVFYIEVLKLTCKLCTYNDGSNLSSLKLTNLFGSFKNVFNVACPTSCKHAATCQRSLISAILIFKLFFSSV